jgi:hypothetical protein
MTNPNPQLAPVLALAELIREHPELPRVDWSMSSTGFFSATWTSDEDARPVAEAYAEVLGGEPRSYTYSRSGDVRQAFQLRTVWRDVAFDLWVSGPVPATVAAVAL